MYLTNRAFDALVDFLDKSYLKKELTDNVKEVYNAEEYKKFLGYRAEGTETKKQQGSLTDGQYLLL